MAASSSSAGEDRELSIFIPSKPSPLHFGLEVPSCLFTGKYGGGEDFKTFRNLFGAHLAAGYVEALPADLIEQILESANNARTDFHRKREDDRFGEIPNKHIKVEDLHIITYDVVVTQISEEAVANGFNLFFHGPILKNADDFETSRADSIQCWPLIGVRDCSGFAERAPEDPGNAGMNGRLVIADHHAHAERQSIDGYDLVDWRMGSDMARVYIEAEALCASCNAVCLDPARKLLNITLLVVIPPSGASIAETQIEQLKRLQKLEFLDSEVMERVHESLADLMALNGDEKLNIEQKIWWKELLLNREPVPPSPSSSPQPFRPGAPEPPSSPKTVEPLLDLDWVDKPEETEEEKAKKTVILNAEDQAALDAVEEHAREEHCRLELKRKLEQMEKEKLQAQKRAAEEAKAAAAEEARVAAAEVEERRKLMLQASEKRALDTQVHGASVPQMEAAATSSTGLDVVIAQFFAAQPEAVQFAEKKSPEKKTPFQFTFPPRPKSPIKSEQNL